MSRWSLRMLGEVCHVRRGTTITQKQTRLGEVPVVGGGTVPTYYHDTANRPPGTITISGSGASAGYVNRYSVPIFASDCSTVEARDEASLLTDFVFRFLQSKQDWINAELRQGAAQPHVYASDIAEIRIPVPSLIEQRRIVAVLDEAFAAIALAMTNAQNALASLESLFTSSAESLFAADEAECTNVQLAEVCELFQGFALNKRTKHLIVSSGIPLLRIKDLRSGSHEMCVAPTGFPKNALVNQTTLFTLVQGRSV